MPPRQQRNTRTSKPPKQASPPITTARTLRAQSAIHTSPSPPATATATTARTLRPRTSAQPSPPAIPSTAPTLRSHPLPQITSSPAKSPKKRPVLPPSLKKAILTKRAEWLDANKRGQAGVSDAVEGELEGLERRAGGINAEAFRGWRGRVYRDDE